MKRLSDIKTENGFVTSIDGNAIPRTKLYGHYIVLSNTNTDKCYTFLVDDNPESYKDYWIGDKYDELTIPCFGLKIDGGKVYQYTEFSITPNFNTIKFYRANPETNKIDVVSNYLYGSFVKSDTVTPLN